jgi:hypothetical protein
MKRRIFAVLAPLAGLSLIAVSLLGVTGSASAITWQSWCAQQGAGSCMTEASDTIDAHINQEPLDTNLARQGVAAQAINICDGGHVVTSNCPFDVGSGLNTAFQGDQIVQLLLQNGGSIGVNGNGLGMWVQNSLNCTGTCHSHWIKWVLAGWSVVNVGASNANVNNHAQYATSPGCNGCQDIVTYPWQSGYSQWGTHNH